MMVVMAVLTSKCCKNAVEWVLFLGIGFDGHAVGCLECLFVVKHFHLKWRCIPISYYFLLAWISNDGSFKSSKGLLAWSR